MEFDSAQHMPQREFLEALLKQIKGMKDKLQNARTLESPNVMDVEFVLPILPSNLPGPMRIAYMQQLYSQMDSDLLNAVNSVKENQYNLLFNEIYPRLQLIQRLQKYIDYQEMSNYGRVNQAVYNKLAQLLADTESPMQQYLNNRNRVWGQIEQSMNARVLGNA